MVKKIFFAFLVSLSLISFDVALAAAPIVPGTVPTYDQIGLPQSPIETQEGAWALIRGIVTVVYTFFFILAVVFFILAAYKYLTSKGDPKEIDTAHKTIIWASVAIAVALIAVSFQIIIKDFLENPTVTAPTPPPQQGN